MDFKEILPILLVIAFSVIGSLSKKKKKQKTFSPQNREQKPKNVFESLLDELQTEIKDQKEEFFPPVAPETKEEFQPQQTSFYRSFERAEEPEEEIAEPAFATAETSHPTYQSIHDLTESHKTSLPSVTKKKKPIVSLHSPSQARKAFIYSEVFNRRHF